MLDAVAAQARLFPMPQRIFSVTLGAVIVKNSSTGGDCIRLSGEGIYFFPIVIGNVLQPTSICRRQTNRQNHRNAHDS